MKSTPLWLQSAPVRELLNLLVDRLDAAEQRGSARAKSVALGERTWPALFQAQMESQKEEFWEHAIAMAKWGWIEVKPAATLKSRSGYASSPRVTVVNEVAIREAVGRKERTKSAAERWRETVYEGLQASDDVKRAVSEFCIDIPGHSMAEVVNQLNKLPALADKPLLLREISSQLFWGMSKVFDNRQSLIASLLGVDECPFPESPIQLQVYLPPGGFQSVLFIENQASFEQAMRSQSGAFESLALVFASGFKGSAQRIRNPDGCSLFYAARGSLSQDLRQTFEMWLLGQQQMPSFFWGDLDFSGMNILTAMCSTFGGLTAWQRGYSLMLLALLDGEGHTPEAAEKKGQRMYSTTSGCKYADDLLIPALQKTKRFLDQEAFKI